MTMEKLKQKLKQIEEVSLEILFTIFAVVVMSAVVIRTGIVCYHWALGK